MVSTCPFLSSVLYHEKITKYSKHDPRNGIKLKSIKVTPSKPFLKKKKLHQDNHLLLGEKSLIPQGSP